MNYAVEESSGISPVGVFFIVIVAIVLIALVTRKK